MEPLTPSPAAAATLTQPSAEALMLAGAWTAFGIGAIERQLDAIELSGETVAMADGTGITALDTAGAWLLQKFLLRLRGHVHLQGLNPAFARLMEAVAKQEDKDKDAQRGDGKPPAPPPGMLQSVGIATVALFRQITALLGFVGEVAMALGAGLKQPSRLRWRPMLFNIRTAGFDALPIVGLLAFLLGIVVAYQGAEQLRRYGANIFVADLVGVSMLREFAPLITAIIIAGRSGSAYAAQIGTMAVTEEIDAMRTLGVQPLELLVLPKLIALMIALPLLTVFADVLGVAGGMLMAKAQLDVGFVEFLERFTKAVSPTSYWVGLAKAPVFAAIIAMVGCFQGFQTGQVGGGGADSVGRQTTRSVVQAIFLVIVADALFSVAFSALKL
ncbi:MlaE family lipid ABC transporter permease subunit [soil metagenome]